MSEMNEMEAPKKKRGRPRKSSVVITGQEQFPTGNESDVPGVMEAMKEEVGPDDTSVESLMNELKEEIGSVTTAKQAALDKRDEKLLESAMKHARSTTQKMQITRYKEELKQNGVDKETIKRMTDDFAAQLKLDVTPMTLKDFKQVLAETDPGVLDYRTVDDMYRMIQKTRIRIGNQLSAIARGVDNEGVQGDLLSYCYGLIYTVEDEVSKLMRYMAQKTPEGRWMMKVMGIGPSITCALRGRLDIDKAPHAGNFQSYCGLNDNNRPKITAAQADQIMAKYPHKGDKGTLTLEDVMELSALTKWPMRVFDAKAAIWNDDETIILGYDWKKCRNLIVCPPYSKALKVTCYQIGTQFIKVQNRPKSLYGHYLRDRRIYETEKNNNFEYADQAAAILERKNFKKDSIAYDYYSKGMLPPAHILQRSMRYATKLFISALHGEMMYVKTGGQPPEMPWIITFGGHHDYIEPEVPFSLD